MSNNYLRDSYYEVLGTTSDGGVVILETTFECLETPFEYINAHKGATGALVYPVSEDTIERALGDEKEDYYEEFWREDAGESNGTTLGLTEWVANIWDDEYIDSRFKNYEHLETEDIAKAVGADVVPERYTVVELGRMFPSVIDAEDFTPLDTDRVRELIALIRDIES